MIIFDKVVENIVEKVFLNADEQFMSRLNENKMLTSWTNSFEKAVELSDSFANGFGKELSSHRAIMRYFYATFDPASSMSKLDNFIISLGLEFLDYQLELPPEVIIGFGSAIMKNWKRELYSDKVLKQKIQDKDCDIQNIDCIYNLNELKQILANKQELRKNFFKEYEHNDGYKKIRIWLPRPDESWIRWEIEHSVDININPMIGMDLGFFRLGYDYSLFYKGEEDKLKFASITESKTKETGEFKYSNIGEKSGQVIWGS